MKTMVVHVSFMIYAFSFLLMTKGEKILCFISQKNYVCSDNGYMYMIHFWQCCDMAM